MSTLRSAVIEYEPPVATSVLSVVLAVEPDGRRTVRSFYAEAVHTCESCRCAITVGEVAWYEVGGAGVRCGPCGPPAEL